MHFSKQHELIERTSLWMGAFKAPWIRRPVRNSIGRRLSRLHDQSLPSHQREPQGRLHRSELRLSNRSHLQQGRRRSLNDSSWPIPAHSQVGLVRSRLWIDGQNPHRDQRGLADRSRAYFRAEELGRVNDNSSRPLQTTTLQQTGWLGLYKQVCRDLRPHSAVWWRGCAFVAGLPWACDQYQR